MAYIVKDIEEDKKENQQKQVPSVSGSSGSPYSGVGQAQPTGNPAPNKQGIGTGFTNLSNYLSAGRGRDKAITSESQRLIGNEKQSFGQAYQGAYNGLNSSKPIELNGGIEKSLDNTKPGQNGPSIGQVLNQNYNGPESIGYQPGEGYGKAQALGDKSTISSVLVSDPKNKANYSQGMKSLDEALYGADPASIAASKKSRRDIRELDKQIGDMGGQFSKDVNAQKEQIQGIKNKTLNELQGYKSKLESDVQGRVDAANKAAAESYANQSVPEGSTLGQWTGAAPGTANIGNQMTAEEERRFGILSSYLGGNAPVRGEAYTPGKYEINKTPVERPESKISDYDKEQLNPVIMNFVNDMNRNGGSFADNAGKIANVLNYIRQFNRIDPERGQAMVAYLSELIQRLDINPSDKRDFINTIRSNSEGK